MRVGRSALDEEAIRLIEEYNPDVEFDWTRILKRQAEAPQPAQRSSTARPFDPGGDRFRSPSVQGRQAQGRPEQGRGARSAARPESIGGRRDRPDRRDRRGQRRQDVRLSQEAEAAFEPPPETVGPEEAAAEFVDDHADVNAVDTDESELAAVTADSTAVEDDIESHFADPIEERMEEAPEERVPAAQARLGSEGVLRLRARYAEVLARISERVADAARAEELKAQAERLNPDAWVTASEVDLGLEQYETVFESLRAVVGRNRKRRRRRRDSAAAGGQREAGAAAAREDGAASSLDTGSESGYTDDDRSDGNGDGEEL